MRKILLTATLITILATTAFAAAYKDITSTQARSLMGKGSSVFLLDVRTPEEYQKAHLEGAVLIPVSQLENRLNEIPKKKRILVYCAVGSRSGAAARILAGKGYSEVYNIADGIMGWYRNGFPISHDKTPSAG